MPPKKKQTTSTRKHREMNMHEKKEFCLHRKMSTILHIAVKICKTSQTDTNKAQKQKRKKKKYQQPTMEKTMKIMPWHRIVIKPYK